MLPAASLIVDYASPALVMVSLGRDFLDRFPVILFGLTVTFASQVEPECRRAHKSEARAAPGMTEDSFRESVTDYWRLSLT